MPAIFGSTTVVCIEFVLRSFSLPVLSFLITLIHWWTVGDGGARKTPE